LSAIPSQESPQIHAISSEPLCLRGKIPSSVWDASELPNNIECESTFVTFSGLHAAVDIGKLSGVTNGTQFADIYLPLGTKSER
jgi:hypothetical protein